jgi:hypothetical protein
MSNVKLSSTIEQCSFHIFLYDKSPNIPITSALSAINSMFYLIQRITDRNSTTSVTILSRLDYPDIAQWLSSAPSCLKLFILLQETLIRGVSNTIGYMEGKWERSGQVLTSLLIVTAHEIKKSFLISNIEVGR